MNARIRLVLILIVIMSFGFAFAEEPAAPATPALNDPAAWADQAPDVYLAKFETSKGTILIEVHREWAPNGADRFYNLVRSGFFDDTRFFRAISGFMVQWGIHGDPQVTAAWKSANIKADPVRRSNKRGMVTFAQGGHPDSRSTQIFINLGDNSRLDGQSFSPFGRVVEGMDVVRSLYMGYGEGAPRGNGPNQGLVFQMGNEYLKKSFTKLDYTSKATIVPIDESAK